MGDTTTNSLFFLNGWSVGQLTFVIHGCLLGDESHVGGGRSINGSSKNTVVGVGRTREGFPSTACESVVAVCMLADPNTDGFALHLLVLADRAGVLSRPLGHGCACVSTD